VEIQPRLAKKIVNVQAHVDGPWFWNRYSARPYVGCRSGCEFCFYRGGLYLGRRDPHSFDELIEAKKNAVELLDRELAKLPPEIIHCGDWQEPAETRLGLSRKMLEVVLRRRFPLLIVERSPLVARDIDLLQQFGSRVGVIVSLSSLDPALKKAFEPRSPDVKHRLQMLAKLRDAGIYAGVALMPILPSCGDDEAHLDAAIAAAVDHGAAFVIGGGLTMSGAQAERTLAAAARLDEELPRRLQVLYGGQGSPPRAYAARIGRLVRELCARRGVPDRMRRFVAGENQRVAEQLFLRSYELELEEASPHRVWAWRKAAWSVDGWPVPLTQVADLRSLPHIGDSIGAQIVKWMA
jgi:DNA repair photolyase